MKLRLTTVLLCSQAFCTAYAQNFPDFRDVPIIGTQSEAVFQQLFSGGHCNTVRGVLFGDSQETCPYGLGAVYFPRLNYELSVRYENTPETPFMGPAAHTGGGSPWAQWLVRNSNAGPGLTNSRLPAIALPPLLSAGKSCLTNGININANQTYGGIFGLQHRADNADPATLLPGTQDFFKRGTGVYLDVFAATNPSSGEVIARVTPNTTPAPSYFQPTVSTLTLSMGLETNSSEIRHQRIGPLAFNGRDYMQVELYGSRADKFTDIVGARFVSSVDRRGWAITSFASGGYQTQHVLESHAACGPILDSLEPDVVFLAFGANDFGNGQTPVTFRTNTLALIEFIRDAVGFDIPVILLADPDREFTGSPAGSGASMDQLPGVLHDIATNLANVCSVNSRLLTHQYGWARQGNLAAFLADNVHYNPVGARLKAQLEIDALYSTFGTRCYADIDDGSGSATPDCGVDINDLLFFLSAFEQGTDSADLDDDGDPSSSNPDDAVDINDLLFFIAHFESGC